MNNTPNTIVIIGGGQAGSWAARTLRDRAFTGRIVLVGTEHHIPYERPPLSKAILLGEAPPESAHLLSRQDMETLAIEWISGTTAVHLDRQARTVELDNGAVVAYDKLILCMGGSARQLPNAGNIGDRIHVLRTLDDAVKLGAALRPSKHMAVIGGGWIGLEVAASAVKKGMIVTVLEPASRLCERSVTLEISDLLSQLHSKNNAKILLGTSLSDVSRDESGAAILHLSNGQKLRSDVVVAGIGLVPNDTLAREAGLECEGGVIVDCACRTSDPHIFAAGDVAVAPNSWSGRRMRLESWQNAQEQGIAAAESALGNMVKYDPLPWFWSHQYDWHVQIVGVPHTYDAVVTRGDPANGNGLIMYLQDCRMVAAVGVNSPRELRFAQRIIQRGTSVNADQLRDPSTSFAKI